MSKGSEKTKQQVVQMSTFSAPADACYCQLDVPVT